MNASTPLAKVVSEALVLGVYSGEAATDIRLILFLARADHGSWTVNGRYNSVGEDLARRVRMSRETFRTAIKRLIRARVVTNIRLGYATTYALTTDFLARCRTLYELRFDLDAIECYHKSQGEVEPRTRVKLNPEQGEVEPPHKRAQLEHNRSATADAARGLRPREDQPMTDHPTDDGFYGDPKPKKRGRWGGDPSGPVLGEDPDKPLAAPKAVRGPDPRSKAVTAVREYFRTKLTPFSESHNVPLFGVVGKMQKNIQFLLVQGHSQDMLERAIDYFASQVPQMMFVGESLWDKFFAYRDEAIKFAAVAGLGSRGGPREDADALAKRLSQQRSE